MAKNSFLLNEGYANSLRIKSASKQYIILKNRKKLIDTSFSSGVLLLGHANQFINNQIKKQISNGIVYGLPSISADKYSILLKKIFNNYSKFIMCSSGSEANGKALRLARSISNKEYIVMTTGSWHGSVDQLLFDENDKKKSFLSNGLTNDIKKKIILVPYNDYEKSKRIIEKFRSKIALIMLEPIQQALPSLYNEEYIKKVYNLSRKNNILICFDEMITGMRVDKFSVQKKLNLRPDLSTFGKIVGGGFSVGIIAITKKIENELKKNNKKVFFGGTFSANPLVTQVGYQTLSYIYLNRKKIYSKLEKLSKYFENRMNLFFKNNNINIKIVRYNSIIRIIYSNKIVKNKTDREIIEKKIKNKIKKFRNFVISEGVFLSERGAIFISYSHSFRNLEYITKTLERASKRYFG